MGYNTINAEKIQPAGNYIMRLNPFRKRQVIKEVKEIPNGQAFFINNHTTYAPTTDKRALAEEGYQFNPVIYSAVREIAPALASIEIEVKRDGEVLDEITEPLKLLRKPRPLQGKDQFIKQLFTDFLLFGEMFCVKVPEGNAAPMELWVYSPLDMQIEPGKFGLPAAYVHSRNNKKMRFPVDQTTGASDIFFHKMQNPLDHWRGQSPLQAAALSGDTFNSGMKWNYSLIKNGGRPSGFIRMEGEEPDPESVNRLREQLRHMMQGEHNAGEVPLLTGGMEWQAVDQSPRDMDWISQMKETAKYIASAFGVPLPLIDNDASTFNNIEQAKERLWTDTVIPLMDEFLSQFNAWLMPFFDDQLEFCMNLDSIPALESVRARKTERTRNLVQDGVLSIDEAREAIGYPRRGGAADELFVSGNKLPLGLASGDVQDEDKQYALQLKALGFDDDSVSAILADELKLSRSERIPPKGARENAQKVLKWREEHPDEIQGMTSTGWRRARQLAEGEPLSEDTIQAMAQFNRHRENGKLDDDKVGKPWTDAGYVAWLGWGGTVGIDWALRQSQKIEREEQQEG